ncbi:tetracycline resistance MFS efflux pump [soil metagenome]
MQTESTNNEKFLTKPLIIIFITVFIDLVGFGIVIPALPFYVESDLFRATPFEIGILFASYSLMQFIFSPVLGSLSDRYGRRPILFFSIIGSAIGYLFIGFAFALWMVFAGRIISGITGGNISTAQAYIADVTTRENRAKGMGLFGATFGLGFIFGPAIGGILSKFGTHVPFFFVSALALANAITLYFVLPESHKPNKNEEIRQNRIIELVVSLKDSRFGLVTLLYFLVIVAFSIMTTTFVQYTMYRFGYNAEQNGYLFAYVGVLAILIQGGIFARLVDKFGEIWLIVVGCILLAGSFFAIPYVGPFSGGLTALLVGIAFFSIGNSLASPALTSLASKEAHDEAQGKTLGILQSAASLARAIGPALSAFLLYSAAAPENIDDYTLFRTFWTAAAIMLLAVFIAIYFVKTEREKILA